MHRNIPIYADLCDIKSETEVRICKFSNKSKTINNVIVRHMVLVCGV